MHDGELTLRTDDAAQTRQLAGVVASRLQAGDVVSLSGELGAGKTCFVQGAAGALGVQRRVTSPTFMLVRLYEEATPPLVHCDVYRLDRLQDVLDLGDEVMARDVVTFIEWGDAVTALLPADRLDVEVLLPDVPPADDEAAGRAPRLLRLRAHGAWRRRLEDLRADCQGWVPDGGG